MIRLKPFFLPIVIVALALATVMFLGPAPVMATGSGDTGHTAEGADAGHGDVAAHGEDAGHGEAGAHGGEHGQLGPSTGQLWDFVWRCLNFGILAIVLIYVLRKPVAGFFGGRRSEIAETLDEFEKKKAEAEVKFKELEGKLTDLTEEREKILADYIREGEEEKEKIIANAHSLAQRIKTQAEASIDQEIKAAKAELVQEIADMSANMAEDLIKNNINDQDQKRLVEEYLSKVVQN